MTNLLLRTSTLILHCATTTKGSHWRSSLFQAPLQGITPHKKGISWTATRLFGGIKLLQNMNNLWRVRDPYLALPTCVLDPEVQEDKRGLEKGRRCVLCPFRVSSARCWVCCFYPSTSHLQAEGRFITAGRSNEWKGDAGLVPKRLVALQTAARWHCNLEAESFCLHIS